MTNTPAALGYRMPAEWEPHEATWIAWPHNRDDWPGKFGPIPWVYVEIVRLLSRAERVEILIQGGKAERRATEKLERAGVDLGRVRFHRVKTDRVWTRDSGPSFVVKDGDPKGWAWSTGSSTPGPSTTTTSGIARSPDRSARSSAGIAGSPPSNRPTAKDAPAWSWKGARSTSMAGGRS